MKKRILATVLGLALLLMAGAAAFAVDDSGSWDVRFTADNQLLSDYTLNGMAGRVFQMQPGDEVELTVNLSNANPDPANWYMTNKVLETLEAARDSATGGAYDYELIYESANYAEPLLLYSSERVGGESGLLADRVGLEQATEGLEDWLYLDTIQPGAGGVVRLRVALDGETQGNTYQDTLARLQLNFAVDPVTSYTEINTVRREIRVVQTGDTNEALPFIILAGVSGLLLLAFGLFGLGEKKRAKKAAKQLTCMALAVVLALTMPAALGLAAYAADGPETPAPADDGGLRSYTVRLSPGLQTDAVQAGTVRVTNAGTGAVLVSNAPAGQPLVLENVAGGTRLDIQINAPEDNGTKYYVRGIRESGEDNTAVNATNFEVDQDKDYVIAYGIKGERVQYVIRFVDAEGNQLADEIIQWGNVGDRPVVACQYIEGYSPNAWNLTKTLVAEDEISANVFEFVYTPLGTTLTTEFIDGGVTVVGGGAAGGAGGAGGGAAAGPAAPAGPGGVVLPEEQTPVAPPEEVVNLDDQQTPLAGLMNDFASSLLGLSTPLRVALVGGVVALGSLIILAVTKKRKKEDAAEG